MKSAKIREVFKNYLFTKNALIAVLAITVVLLAALNLGAGASGSQSGGGWWNAVKNNWNSLFNKTGTAPAQVVKIIDEQSEVIDVVKQNSPAVVSIIETAQVPKYEQCYQQGTPFMNLPPEFQQFFNQQIPSLCQNGTQEQKVGAGSGFIVSPDGYIVTNKHVVEDPNADYTVILNDQNNFGKKLTAKVLARAPDNDIAILKIDGANLPFVTLGDSSNIQVGQTVITIGYALGQFDNTVSKGVISGLSRKITADGAQSAPETLTGLIQTDAAINPGNSGGPLLDITGKAIGMNSAMADAQNIGFAIPINEIKTVYEEVKNTGKIAAEAKVFLGIRYMPVTQTLKDENKLPYDYGMIVIRGQNQGELAVLPGSPADKAGIVEDDIILEADGKQLNENYLLSDAIADKKPGDTIILKVYHKGQISDIKIVLGKS